MKINTKFYRPILVLLCLVILFASGCSGKGETNTDVSEKGDDIDYFTTGTQFQFAGEQDGYQLVADNANFSLLMEPETFTMLVKNKKTGYTWKTNLTEEDFANYPYIDDSVKAEYMSQLDLVYFNSSNKEIKYNSYNYSVASHTEYNKMVATYALSDNRQGIRVVYKIGESIDDAYFPKGLSAQTFQTLYDAMDDEGKMQLELYFDNILVLDYDDLKDDVISILYRDQFMRDEYNALTGEAKEKYLEETPPIQELDEKMIPAKTGEFSKLGKVAIFECSTVGKNQKVEFVNTYLKPTIAKISDKNPEEWLEAEYKTIGYTFEFPDVPMFVIPVEYELTEKGLSVDLDADQIQFEKGFKLHAVRLLPFFGTASNYVSGNMVIPDGSGALVDLSVQNKNAISLPIYGQDLTLRTKDYAENMQQSVIPAYGVDLVDSTYGKNAFIAHVSQGEAQGSIECHPKTTIYPFGYVGPNFIIHPYETFKAEGAAKTANLQKYSDDRYFGNISIDYYFLDGDNADYVGMAKTIRDLYFGDSAKATNANTKFYYETYGEILRKETLVGYAYNAKRAMTTIEQATAIYDKLVEGGIKNISVKYTNWYGDEYTNSINKAGDKVASTVGSNKEMKEFIRYVEQAGGKVYPNLELILDKNTGSLVDANWHVKMIEGTLAKYDGNNAIYQEGVTVSFDRTVIKSGEILSKLSSVIKKTDKLGINAYSLSTLGSSLFSDYADKTLLHRDEVKEDAIEIMKKMSNDNQKDLLVEVGNAYTYKYADDIINVSLGNSCLSFEKESIPFTQIVLHGYIPYSGVAMNLSDNKAMSLLKSVEYGSNVYYILNDAAPSTVKSSNYSSLFSTEFDRWYDESCADYKFVASALDGLQASCIYDHAKLAENVYMTTYEDANGAKGASVIVNYGKADYNYNGTVVPANNFKVVK